MATLDHANRPPPPSTEAEPTHVLSVTIRQASRISGLSVPSIYREASKGNIVLLKYGRTTLIDMASLRAFVAGLPHASIRPPRKVA